MPLRLHAWYTPKRLFTSTSYSVTTASGGDSHTRYLHKRPTVKCGNPGAGESAGAVSHIYSKTPVPMKFVTKYTMSPIASAVLVPAKPVRFGLLIR